MNDRVPRMKVLVVENDPVFRGIVTDILAQEGHEVLVAEDGLAALEILEQQTPEIFLVDLIMPGIGGEKLCRIVRANPRFDRSLLVMLSAVAAENEVEAAAAGADVCMNKVSRRELTERFRQLFAEFRQGRFGFPSTSGDIKNTDRRIRHRAITRELLALRSHLELILDSLTEGVMELAVPTGKILYANQMAASFWGQPEEKLLGVELPLLFPEGLRSDVQQLIAAAPSQRSIGNEGHVVPIKGRLMEVSALLLGGIAAESLLFFLRDVTATVHNELGSRAAHLELDQIFNSSPDGQLIIDVAGNIVRMNPAYRAMFQVPEQEGSLMQCAELAWGPRCHTEQCSLKRILAGETRVEIEEEKRRADGSVLSIHLVATPLRDPDGHVIGIIENCRDISERHRHEQELENSSARFKAIFDNTLVGILFATRDRRIADLNDRAASQLGYRREELIGQSLETLHLSPAHFARFGEEVLAKASSGGLIQLEYQLRHKDGRPVWAQLSGKVVSLPELGGEGTLWVADDITQRKQAEEDQRQIIAELRTMQEALRSQSIRDPLTGLFNRRYMEESLQREISKARRYSSPMALFMLDLDHFKQVNDTYGHATGDWVLRKLGELIRYSIREEDIACRYGGEEFVLIFPGIEAADARRRAEDLRTRVVKQLAIEHLGQRVGGMTVSIGIAMHEPGLDRETMLQRADSAMYRAKNEGRNRVVI